MEAENSGWERRTIEQLAHAALKEQRTARRWGIFFKLLTFAYLGAILLMAMDLSGAAQRVGSDGKHTALVELNGVIDSGGEASADRINAALQRAFKDGNTKGVVLRINSPGGSPVQSGLINDEMRRLRAKYPNIPLHVVIEDVCASGGYYVAAAADKIFVDKASLIGSIGVLMDGFGFVGSMQKLGVERRLITAGENKGFLDPFSPQQESQQRHARELVNAIHQQFIDVVRKGRGNRLKDDASIFSGLIWTGEGSLKLGLADAFGSLDYVAREVIKAEKVIDFTQRENFAERVAKRIGAGAGEAASRWLMPPAGASLR